MRKNLPMLALLLIATSLITGCDHKPLKAVAGPPQRQAQVTVPEFAKTCPPLVSWYPNRTCKPAPK